MNILVPLLCIISCGHYSTHANKDLRLLDKTLQSLEKLLQYLHRTENIINLDCVLGVRIAQEFLTSAITRLPPSLPASRLRNLRNLADEISTDAQPHVKHHTPDYYQTLWPMLAPDFWAPHIMADEPPFDPTTLAFPDGPRVRITENKSDICISELLGTGRTGERCAISDECWTTMTSLDISYHNYSLSHQLFYIIIGVQAGCYEQMVSAATAHQQPTPGQLTVIFCSRIADECRQIAEENFPPARRDLFMEEATLCGMLGFSEFMRKNWLERVISWQKSSGCFAVYDDTKLFFTRLLHSQKWMKNDDRGNHHRNKRLETPLPNGCLSHKSGIAVGYLALHVNYIIENLIE